MKARYRLVSNSSSSSFVIPKGSLTNSQLEAIQNHISYAGTQLGWVESDEKDRWFIEEDEWNLYASTPMDNFDLGKFLEQIGVRDGRQFQT